MIIRLTLAVLFAALLANPAAAQVSAEMIGASTVEMENPHDHMRLTFNSSGVNQMWQTRGQSMNTERGT